MFGDVELSNSAKYVITNVSDSVSELVVVGVTIDDQGIYTCDVQNIHGDDMRDAMLTVICESGVVVYSRTISNLDTLGTEESVLISEVS